MLGLVNDLDAVGHRVRRLPVGTIVNRVGAQLNLTATGSRHQRRECGGGLHGLFLRRALGDHVRAFEWRPVRQSLVGNFFPNIAGFLQAKVVVGAHFKLQHFILEQRHRPGHSETIRVGWFVGCRVHFHHKWTGGFQPFDIAPGKMELAVGRDRERGADKRPAIDL